MSWKFIFLKFLNMKTIHELMEWRFACKHFVADKNIPEDQLRDILDSARLAPSSFGLQAWKFIVVTNKELLQKLAEPAYGQSQVKEAAALVVFCARNDFLGEEGVIKKHVDNLQKLSGKTDEEMVKSHQNFVDMIEAKGVEGSLAWAQRQVYIPVETLIIAAAEKEIDSAPMEGFDPIGVAKVLELPENLHPTVLVALGYRNMEAPKKARTALETVVEFRN